MRKIEVRFQIQSVDTSDQFVSMGEYKNNRIIFTDTDNNTNYIIFHTNSIEYYKKGTVDMKYKFQMKNKTKGEYTTQGYSLEFDIFTNVITHQNQKLEIEYDLYQGDDLVNKTKIVLEYTFIEEE